MMDILFDCYKYYYEQEGETTIFMFWPDGLWDEEKYTLEEALSAYPPSMYNWIKMEEE